jgi:hypothetical protein
MSEKTCARCATTFEGYGGARYCRPACRRAAAISRAKTRRLAELRAIGETIYARKAAIAAGQSTARAWLADRLREHGIDDLEDELAHNDELAATLAEAEAAETAGWDLLVQMRRVIESHR